MFRKVNYKKKGVILLIGSFVLVLTACDLSIAGESYTVGIEVVDQDDVPVENAEVKLGNLTPVNTDEHGLVEFGEIEEGIYNYTVTIERYIEASGELVVDQNIVFKVIIQEKLWEEKVILDENFAGLSPGGFWQDGWVTDFRSKAGGEIVELPAAENNRAAKVEVDGDPNHHGYYFFNRDISRIAEEGYDGMKTGIRVLEVSVLIPDQDNLPVVDIGVRQARSNHHRWTPVNGIRFNSKGEIGIVDNDSEKLIEKVLMEYNTNEWYHVTMVFDLDQKIKDVYINNELISQGVLLDSSEYGDDGIGWIRFAILDPTLYKGIEDVVIGQHAYFDNIKLYEVTI